MSEIHCKYCNAPINNDCINVNFRFLYCRACDNFDHFDPKDLKLIKYLPPSKPKTEIRETPDKTTILLKERYTVAGTILLVFSCIGFWGASQAFHDIKRDESVIFAFIFLGLGFGLIPLVIGLHCLFTFTYIEITAKHIRISKRFFSHLISTQRRALSNFADIREVIYQNSKSQVTIQIALNFSQGKPFKFGQLLSDHERRWLITEINRLIEAHRKDMV